MTKGLQLNFSGDLKRFEKLKVIRVKSVFLEIFKIQKQQNANYGCYKADDKIYFVLFQPSVFGKKL